MVTTLIDKLKITQGHLSVRFKISESFPILGDLIVLQNTSINADSRNWVLNNGLNTYEDTNIDNVVTPLYYGNLGQTLVESNTIETKQLTKYIYPLHLDGKAYFKFTIDSQVNRVGLVNTLTIIRTYNPTIDCTYNIKIYNKIGEIVIDTYTPNLIYNFTILNRGYYDIKITSTVVDEGDVECFQGKILNILPTLPDINSNEVLIHTLSTTEEAIGIYGTIFNVIDAQNYRYSGLPIPNTIKVIILRKSASHTEDSLYRVKLINFLYTEENPLIITVEDQFNFKATSYWGVYICQSQHIILDGYGYANTINSLNIDGSVMPIIINGVPTTDVEICGVEIQNAGFCGISCKSDPDPVDSSAWRCNYAMYNMLVNNCYIHNTNGEGLYYGYFNGGYLGEDYQSLIGFTQEQLDAATFTERAHRMVDTKIFRNRFYQCGYDSIQLNNATGDTEICYNDLIESARAGALGQATFMSLGLEGRVYNNICDGNRGAGIQFAVVGPVKFYNNLFINVPKNSVDYYLMSGQSSPENGSLIANEQGILVWQPYFDTEILICNNLSDSKGNTTFVKAASVCYPSNVKIINNIYSGSILLSGGESANWDLLKSNNIFLSDSNYVDYMLRDYENKDFNIHPDSILANTGTDVTSYGILNDLRGYKNLGKSPYIGPYCAYTGKYLVDVILDSIVFETGNNIITTLNFAINFINIGGKSITDYMLSYLNTFEGAVWVPYTTDSVIVELTPELRGTKTLYGKIKHNNFESEVKYIEFTITLPALISLSINQGNTDTTDSIVNINLLQNYSTQYMLSEDINFTNVEWSNIIENTTFTLSEGIGSKTIYGKLKNNFGESEVFSSNINLVNIVEISTLSINTGEPTTYDFSVNLICSVTSGVPSHYMVSESPDFTGGTWKVWKNTIWTNLTDGSGTKTIYFKVKDISGNISSTLSDSIQYIDSLTIISTNERMRWDATENLNTYTGVVESIGVVINKMTMSYNNIDRNLYDTQGNLIGTAVGSDNVIEEGWGYGWGGSPELFGNLGIYDDKVLSANGYGSYLGNNGPTGRKFIIPQGVYDVSVMLFTQEQYASYTLDESITAWTSIGSVYKVGRIDWDVNAAQDINHVILLGRVTVASDGILKVYSTKLISSWGIHGFSLVKMVRISD